MARNTRSVAFPSHKAPPGALKLISSFSCTQAREALFSHQGQITLSASDFSKDCRAIRNAWRKWETPTEEYGGQLLTPCPKGGPLSLADMWALYCLRVGLDYYLHTQNVSSPRSRWTDVVNKSEEVAMSLVMLAGGSREDFNQRIKTYLSHSSQRLTGESAESIKTVNVNPVGAVA